MYLRSYLEPLWNRPVLTSKKSIERYALSGAYSQN